MAENIKNDTPTKDEHGSVNSYIIGFALSLVLTIIPYYMVTQKVTSGTTLLLIVLGLAVIQMLVQIFFFLHLGRGPKPLYNVVFFVATAAFITVVVGASLLIMDNLYRNMSPEEVTMRLAQDENIAEINGNKTGACQGNKANHVVTIENNVVNPGHIEAQRCDTITFDIEDDADRTITFSTQGDPTSYGGLDEVHVRGDRVKIVTLNELGDFSFHDKDSPLLMGHFSVIP